ncbi:MAG: hypothetical protein L0312_07945, partial [Acidobacteria bacterium]|nr:hypothetical protein [Acidobacteriota bacterium]
LHLPILDLAFSYFFIHEGHKEVKKATGNEARHSRGKGNGNSAIGHFGLAEEGRAMAQGRRSQSQRRVGATGPWGDPRAATSFSATVVFPDPVPPQMPRIIGSIQFGDLLARCS